jgi:hypothetical protein
MREEHVGDRRRVGRVGLVDPGGEAGPVELDLLSVVLGHLRNGPEREHEF